jgi:hypothetical protein
MPARAALDAEVTSVPSSTGAVELAGANPDRRGLSVYNASTAVLYLKYGSGASSSSYTVAVPASALYELPPVGPVYASGEVVGGCYAGQVTGAWASENGSAKVTEVT